MLETSSGVEGHGLTFTLGRGTELCVTAIEFLARFVVGRTLRELTTDMGTVVRTLSGDTQFRWLGPDKGVIHLAAAALINAVWDLWARVEGKPVWRLLADMSPEQIVSLIDFTYIDDALSKDDALQAGSIDVCQIDSCRVAGVNENLAIILMAAKFGIPVCPHAGGVGLCEYVVHLSAFDYIYASASLENRVVEFVDHLHEHFVTPTRIRQGRYLLPPEPGYSIEVKEASLVEYAFPGGTFWSSEEAMSGL